MSDPILFDPAFLQRLERLALVVRRIKRGYLKGERRSRRRGQSVEFADYRNYVPGDDLRALDWNIYARLEKPFIKLFEEEVDQTVHILVDASGSMDWPPAGAELVGERSPYNKWHYARRLAAALGYIALSNQDRLYVAGLSEDRFRRWGPERNRQSVHKLLAFLSGYESGGLTSLTAALDRYARQARRAGLLFIISDFLSDDDLQAGLSALQYRGHEITLLHLLSPDEIEPTLGGDLQLVDVESGIRRDISINSTMLALYRQHFVAWQEGLAQLCHRRGINYALIGADHPFDELILRHLRQRGFVR